MFFFASKILWALVAPLNFCALALSGGLACLGWPRGSLTYRIGRSLIGLVVLIFLAFGILPFGRDILVALENRYPPLTAPPTQVDGIILLGGAIETALPSPLGLPQTNDHADRILEFARLARQFPQARLIFTGGTADISQTGAKESDLFPPLLSLLGISPERMEYENNSRNTYENAIFSKYLAAPKPGQHWILVTSAFHMPRSVAIFESAGWPVIPAPADYKTDGKLRILPTNLNVAGNLSDFSTALREIIGMAAYAASGKITLEKPAP